MVIIYLIFFTGIELPKGDIEDDYNSLLGYKYKYNEYILTEGRGVETVVGWGGQTFYKEADLIGNIYYVAGAGGFLEWTKNIAYNPKGADIGDECPKSGEISTCECNKRIGRCGIIWKY